MAPRNFGRLTDVEEHTLGHIQELQRLVDHLREHFYAEAGRRLEVPAGTKIQVALTELGPYLVENVPPEPPRKARSPRGRSSNQHTQETAEASDLALSASEGHV